jgi:hypothetical protein
LDCVITIPKCLEFVIGLEIVFNSNGSMDVSAVGGIVCGSFFPGYYYWMYKHENWRIIYISVFAVFMILAM